MEKRLEKERRGRTAEEITKLNLDNCQATSIEGLTDEYKNLSNLTLVNVGLTTLKGFPQLPKLRKLDLSDNRISGDLDLLQGSPSLSCLNLSGNQIKDLETLQPLKSLKELHNLDLFNCEVTNTEGYKEKVFELLDGLLYLDGFDKNGQEADLEDGEDDSEDDDDEEDEEEEVGLEYLQKQGLEDESEGEEFAPGDDDNDVDDLDDECDDSEDEPSRGTKRKRDANDEAEDTEDK